MLRARLGGLHHLNIEIRDDRFLDIVPEDLELETLADGFAFTEGPIWHPHEQHLIFSDIPNSRMHRWTEKKGVKVFRKPSHMTNGNTYDHEGRILSCEHETSRVTRTELNGTITVLASHYDGKELNSPNDIVVRRDGSIYFTDPTFGRLAGTGSVRKLELDHRGVYRIAPDTLELTLLATGFGQPNGLAFTLDHQALYVADTPRLHIRRFEIDEDGGLSGGEVFAESTGEGAGAPDGLKIDSLGHVFCAGPGGVHVYHPDDGTCLGVIRTPAFCANFTWGDDDFCTFFMTSSTCLYRTRLKVPGIPLF